MKVTRITKASDGGSRFEEIEIRLGPAGHSDSSGRTAYLSDFRPGLEWAVGEAPEGMSLDWHPAPQRQLAVILAGVLEVETSDGERRSWRAGELLLADDADGRGHRTRIVEGPVRLLFLLVPDAVVFDGQKPTGLTDRVADSSLGRSKAQ